MTEVRPPYAPKPFAGEEVDLPPHLLPIIERLAEQVHEVWSAGRLRDGWRYGASRDDQRREHPGLVPYSELTEDEREYDRSTVLATLRGLLALGYTIAPPSAVPGDRGSQEAEAKLAATRVFLDTAPVPELIRFWQDHQAREWAVAPDLYLQLARRFIRATEHLLAYEVTAEGLLHWPESGALLHLKGLSLSRAGAFSAAHEVATDLYQRVLVGGVDSADPGFVESAISLLGRTKKDLALRETGEARARHLREAMEAYREAFERSGGYYSAINVATMAHLVGEREIATGYAEEARSRALQQAEADRASGRPAFWALATVGEAALVNGGRPEAERYYREAVREAGDGYAEIATMRKQAALLVDGGPADPWIADVFALPVVAVVEQPHRRGDLADFDPDSALVHAIARRFGAIIAELGVRFGYSTGASPAEILFLDAVAEAGGETYVVLPYARDEFVLDAFGAGSPWIDRFDRVLGRAREVIVASDTGMENRKLLLDYAYLIMNGLALMKGNGLETSTYAIHVCPPLEDEAGGRDIDAGEALDLQLVQIGGQEEGR